MTTLVTITCDRCNDNIPQDAQIWEVGALAKCRQERVSSHPRNFSNSMYQVKGHHKMEVCRSCLIHLGFITGDKEQPDPPTVPSLEEILREIISVEVQDAMEGGY